MELHERINKLIKEKKLTKKEFIDKFLNLYPVLKKTGEVPKERAIYGWLSGRTAIEADMLPYFADVLGVGVEAFFDNNNTTYKNFSNLSLYSKEISFTYGNKQEDNTQKKPKNNLIIDRRALHKQFEDKDIKAMVVHGDSMRPYVEDGDIVLFEDVPRRNRPDGKYVVETEDGMTVKDVKFCQDGSVIVADGAGDRAHKWTMVDAAQLVGHVVGRILKS